MGGRSNRLKSSRKFIRARPILRPVGAIALHLTRHLPLSVSGDQAASQITLIRCSCHPLQIRCDRMLQLHHVSSTCCCLNLEIAYILVVYWRPTPHSAINAAANLIQVTGSQHGLGLAPAPDIQAGRRRRSSASHPPPPLPGSSQRKHFSDLGHTPRTPATPRAGILRMPSQQAEKDAVDTLLFMSSPNNSQRFPHTSQTAPSPLRADAPQRRVMFDAYPPQERRIVYQPQMPPPQHHQYGPYAAHPAR
jgi:hypothetical protein